MSLELFMLFSSVGFVIGVLFAKLVGLIEVNTLEKKARLLLDDYKTQLTGHNRFLVDEKILKQVFPEYSEKVVRKVWIRLLDSKAIDKDLLDGAWCIK